MPKINKTPLKLKDPIGDTKVTKRVLEQSKSPEKTIQVGSRVRVVTEYVVKRMDSQRPSNPLYDLVAVEDARGDRVLNFRLDELEVL